ncbi:hypothetical protein PI124_g6671 [Phytophthora idaei]|nr:hypothetical protein PI124_g6671 [Phytophthora idaei]
MHREAGCGSSNNGNGRDGDGSNLQVSESEECLLETAVTPAVPPQRRRECLQRLIEWLLRLVETVWVGPNPVAGEELLEAEEAQHLFLLAAREFAHRGQVALVGGF